MPTPVTQSQLSQALAQHGMALRGGFAVTADDDLPGLADGRPAKMLLLVGNIGGNMWPAFTASGALADPHPDRLDRWTKTVIDALAAEIGAVPLYPFSGPPYFPFQRWAARAEPVHVSPLRIFIHPTYGLWHAYRAALICAEPIDLAPAVFAESPCTSCAGRPCLSSCPVGAFQESGFDDLACAHHVDGPHGAECRDNGCLARRACPVGRDYSYPPPQMAFHMEAFLAGRRRSI